MMIIVVFRDEKFDARTAPVIHFFTKRCLTHIFSTCHSFVKITNPPQKWLKLFSFILFYILGYLKGGQHHDLTFDNRAKN